MKYLIALLLTAIATQAATLHVGPSATGNGSGSDWNNQMDMPEPNEWVRGNTYYLADGSYGLLQFSTATSGTTLITVKKAIESDHGSETGWSSALGDGQASFNQINLNTSYVTMDGQVGFGAPWYSEYTPYGFKADVGGTISGIRSQNDLPRSGLTFRHIEVDGNSNGTTTHDGIRFNQGGFDNTFSRMWFHDWDRVVFKIGQGTSPGVILDDWLFEYIFANDFSKNTGIHSEIMSARRTGKCVVRYSVFRDFRSTGGFIIGHGNGWEFYGNVFFWTSNLGQTANNGVIGTWSSSVDYHVENFKIYNNTFYNIAYNNAKRLFPIANSSSGHVITNNIWINCGGTSSVFGSGTAAHDYNAFFNHGLTETEANKQELGSNPLANPSAGNFRLTFATASGPTTEFATDPDGNTRGSDGVWDRGAFEFVGGEDETPPVISNIQATGVGHDQATVSATANEIVVWILDYGTTDGFGTSLTNSSDSQTSFNLSDLGAETTYHYRFTATDLSDNETLSTTNTFETLVLDETAPIVSLTAPEDEAELTGTETFSATASDNVSVSDVRWFLNGTQAAMDTSSPYSQSVNTSQFANGSYSVWAEARDPSGNVGFSDTNTVAIFNESSEGLQHHWRFDESVGSATAVDSEGAENGTVVGAAYISGVFGNAITFSGTGQRVEIASLNFDTNAFSVMAWVKADQILTDMRIVSRATSTSMTDQYWGLELATSLGDPQWGFRLNTGGTTIRLGGGTVTLNEWTHVAGTYDGTTMRLYVDGQEVSTASLAGNVRTGEAEVWVGDNPPSGGRRLAGAVDDLRIYNSTVSAGEILQFFNAPTLPSAPENVNAAGSSGKITVSWNPPATGSDTLVSYEIYRGTSSGNLTLLDTIEAPADEYEDETAAPATQYFYAILAINTIGEGPLSAEAIANLTNTLRGRAQPGLLSLGVGP